METRIQKAGRSFTAEHAEGAEHAENPSASLGETRRTRRENDRSTERMEVADLDPLEEIAVHAEIARELRVEGREEDAALAHEHGLFLLAREHLDRRPQAREARRAD